MNTQITILTPKAITRSSQYTRNELFKPTTAFIHISMLYEQMLGISMSASEETTPYFELPYPFSLTQPPVTIV